jgi:hypothetical protein
MGAFLGKGHDDGLANAGISARHENAFVGQICFHVSPLHAHACSLRNVRNAFQFLLRLRDQTDAVTRGALRPVADLVFASGLDV